MASFNAQIRHMSIPELKKELDTLSALIYDDDHDARVKYEAQIRACYVQRELQIKGVEVHV
jgi:hypothetical protein